MNTNYISLLSLTDLKSETVIQGNVDSALLLPYVKLAQENFIQQELGVTLYEQIIDEVNTYALSGITGTTLNLVNEMKTTLAYYTFYTAFPFLWAKITNKGITTKPADQTSGDSVKKEDMEELRGEVLNWSQKAHNSLRRFLYLNKAIYTTWREYADNITDYPWNNPNPKKEYFSGIQFKKKFNNDPMYNSDDYK